MPFICEAPICVPQPSMGVSTAQQTGLFLRLDDPEVTVNLSEQDTDEDLAISLLSWIMSS